MRTEPGMAAEGMTTEWGPRVHGCSGGLLRGKAPVVYMLLSGGRGVKWDWEWSWLWGEKERKRRRKKGESDSWGPARGDWVVDEENQK